MCQRRCGGVNFKAIHGLYVSQYNSILNEEEFSEPYKIICEGYCEVLAKTIFAGSDYGLLTCSSAAAYNDMLEEESRMIARMSNRTNGQQESQLPNLTYFS